MADDIAIKVDGISKTFKLPHEKQSSIKSALINFRRTKKGYEKQQVLKNVSFEIKKGEFFGIVGRNGSGKSTLLKLLAGIYTADKGNITINGKLTPFIELGVGFNPELSGRENVFLNGALLGFNRKEMEAMYDEIVEFAELERFMDQKLKNYSSGMQVRLAFAIAIQVDTDILILDEVLAVGDEAFQRKSNKYFEKIRKEKGKTVVLVTHSMEAVRKYCSKAMMIQEGIIVAVGSPEDVANEYSMENLSVKKTQQKTIEQNHKDPIIKDLKIELLSPKKLDQNTKATIRYTILTDKDIDAGIVMDLYNIDDNYYLYCSGSPVKQIKRGEVAVFEVTFDISPFNNMNIIVHSSVHDIEGNILDFSKDTDSPQFIIRRNDYKDSKKPQVGVIYKDGKNVKWM